jgi:hypothetical protein
MSEFHLRRKSDFWFLKLMVKGIMVVGGFVLFYFWLVMLLCL